MKLAIVTHNVCKGDGQGRVNYELALHALAHRSQVTLVADSVDEAVVSAGAQWIRISPRIRRPLISKVWSFARSADPVAISLKAQGYTVVGNGFSLRAPHQYNIAHMVHATWMNISSQLKGRVSARRIYQDFYTSKNTVWEKQAFDAADHVIAVSDQIRRSLIAIGISSQKISLVWNGVDLQEFHPGNESREESLPQNVPLGIFVGDLKSPRKNLQIVLKALTRQRDVHLAIAGNLHGSPFPEMANKLGVADRAHFLGSRRDVARLMRMCDFCLFPSHYDPFGLVVLEAMASGLPVAVSRAAGASELIDASCGFILDPNDENDWVKALDVFAHDGEKRRLMGSAARSAALGHSWQNMAQQYLNLFEKCGDGR